MYPFYEAGEKKNPKGQSCKGFPLHQWGTSMERCIPPPQSQPQDRAELGDRIQAQPHGRKTHTDALLLAVPRDA